MLPLPQPHRRPLPMATRLAAHLRAVLPPEAPAVVVALVAQGAVLAEVLAAAALAVVVLAAVVAVKAA